MVTSSAFMSCQARPRPGRKPSEQWPPSEPEFSNVVALAVMAALLVALPEGLVAKKVRQV